MLHQRQTMHITIKQMINDPKLARASKEKCSKWSNFNIKWVAYIYEVLKQKPKPITDVRNAKQNVMWFLKAKFTT